MKIKNLIPLCLTLISFIYLGGMSNPEKQQEEKQEQSNEHKITKVKSLKLQAATQVASTVFVKEIKNLQEDIENIIFDIIDNPKINNKDTILKLIEYIQKTDRVQEVGEITISALTKQYTDKYGRYRMLIGFLSNDIGNNQELIKTLLNTVQPETRNQILLSKNGFDGPVIVNAIDSNKLDLTQQLLDMVDIETRNNILFDQNILVIAIDKNLIDLAKSILEKTDPTIRNQLFLSNSILETAGDNNQVELVKMILEMADFETKKQILIRKDKYGWSVLRFAIRNNRLPLVRILLEMADSETRKQMLVDRNDNSFSGVTTTAFTLALEYSPESILILLDPQLVDEQTRKEIVLICNDFYFNMTKRLGK